MPRNSFPDFWKPEPENRKIMSAINPHSSKPALDYHLYRTHNNKKLIGTILASYLLITLINLSFFENMMKKADV